MYVDFTSLYPWTQKYCEFPVGIPIVITENLRNINEYFGLVHCTVSAPDKLLFPELPSKINGKLIFALCYQCAIDECKSCNHNAKQRQIEGTWCTEEVKEAIKRGYKIVKIHSVWHWEIRDDKLFSDYVDSFLKLKQESSGYPEDCNSDELKDKYINNYPENEGIKLDKDNIKKNSCMRLLAKLFLNSHWGRYCLQTNKTQLNVVKTKEELLNLVYNDNLLVK
jgi:hypothetical protein